MRYAFFALVGFASAQLTNFMAPQTLVTKEADLPYSPDMSCSACMRSGNNYCNLPGPGDKTTCIKGGDIDGLRKLAKAGCYCQNTGMNSAMAVYQFCEDAFDKREEICGKRDHHLDGKEMNMTSLNISVPYGESCFYRVESACGWPIATLNVTYFDLAAALVDMTGEEDKVKFPSPTYPFRSNETITSNTLNSNSGKTEIVF